MQISPVHPPVTTLPVDPTPPGAGTPGVTPMPPVTPAHDLVERYADQLAALGASGIEVVDSETVALTYTNNFAGVQAAGALNDVVDGVRMLVENRSLTADYWTVTGENVATWLEQSQLVEKVERRETHPMQLAVFGSSGGNESALASLLRTQLDDGTSIAVQRRMWAL